MFLLAGLGNPGSKYSGNRHNVGFMALDAIHARFGFPPYRKKFECEAADGEIDGARALLLKPATFMNESGRAVGAALRFYKEDAAALTVIHDELDLAPGKIRLKRGGGVAGHNGLKSIAQHIGPDFRRMRVGIGHPGEKALVTGHVLSDFSKTDRDWVERTVEAIAEAVPILLDGDDAGFANRVALILNPPAAKKAENKKTENKDQT
ncbi:MAG: aminoacyl-tRNA hydrolase [Rhodospirillales bacterium]|jgi:PTH1 family peptidyl-tRNA hydrolase|nr:aminoacyl-tRNA hydrolase [Rhodospirillaceae bacterium]MDP6430457.1 aminoacyl-tRNA hydrolase [Rhodospirillales bacterium]MDP6646506.1 aminoacyl-tRNA hydrolase [Rhodospirillales bacterium]MDP6840147.1 aminoacyl-tRNA hydrolase [Rhodospirillales bacterium]|tara:strand:- start:203 stop:823 length:621 start_codon:yes stop_codon:yes gene_type:complete